VARSGPGLLWQAHGALDILRHMQAPENRSIQLGQASLTTREQRNFARAERTIATGLKSFLAVGMALKEIRHKRLCRLQYDMFEETRQDARQAGFLPHIERSC
jgi:hypothetical protein